MITIQVLFQLIMVAGAIIGVFFNLNNKLIRHEEQIKAVKDQLKEDRERAAIADAATAKNYEKFSDALQKNTHAIGKIEVVLEKFNKN